MVLKEMKMQLAWLKKNKLVVFDGMKEIKNTSRIRTQRILEFSDKIKKEEERIKNERLSKRVD